MSFSKKPLPPEVLHELTKQLREQPTPKADWEQIELELFQRLEQEPVTPSLVLSTRSLQRRKFVVWGAGVAAVAAAFALWAFRSQPSEDHVATTPTVQQTPAKTVAEQPKELPVLRSDDKPLALERAGLATWELEPHSVAKLVEDGRRVVLDLQKGSVRVHVIPQPEAERFVVLAAGVRVAVHGTKFRVQRSDSKVKVDLIRGVVALTPHGKDAKLTMLHAPAGADVDLSVAQGSVVERPLETYEAPPAVKTESSATTPSTAVATKPVPKVDPTKLIAQQKREFSAKIAEVSQSCFEQGVPGNNSGVNISAQSMIQVEVSLGRRVKSVSFSPPLAPRVEQCVRQQLVGQQAPAGNYARNLTLVGRR
jgi:hypothetical protein